MAISDYQARIEDSYWNDNVMNTAEIYAKNHGADQLTAADLTEATHAIPPTMANATASWLPAEGSNNGTTTLRAGDFVVVHFEMRGAGACREHAINPLVPFITEQQCVCFGDCTGPSSPSK